MKITDSNFKNTCLLRTNGTDYWVNLEAAVIKNLMTNWQFLKVPTLELIKNNNVLNLKEDKCWIKSSEIEAIEDYTSFAPQLKQMFNF
ncbi:MULTISPECIES: hypothetical protein [Lactobacillus]|uniref:Uncharacterized protein n=1 Tax=Lactobacillus xujianguonis TaxID=2495899 RepID=A0A437SWD3_9LACO|nr:MULTISPECIES: hypothetical protein [Lactobacillus]RVU71236.1 hypothetical protein EJK17_03310 [Lactobacillus xujianguonis]RVU74109.1 hypothetical protein EJK20_04725 [Lactobacillus xujianguonis]